MPRPRKRRLLLREPQPAIFKPVGLPLELLDRVTLLHEELEALRLADLEGHRYADAAARMGVSRSTFQRLVAEARRKTALALVGGLALHVAGGTFHVAEVHLRCAVCGHEWRVMHGSGQGQRGECPACGGAAVDELQDNAG